MHSIELRIDPVMWDNTEIRERLTEQMRHDLAREFYDAGQAPKGAEKWDQRLAKVVMVDGHPTHEDADEDDADHLVITLSRAAK